VPYQGADSARWSHILYIWGLGKQSIGNDERWPLCPVRHSNRVAWMDGCISAVTQAICISQPLKLRLPLFVRRLFSLFTLVAIKIWLICQLELEQVDLCGARTGTRPGSFPIPNSIHLKSWIGLGTQWKNAWKYKVSNHLLYSFSFDI